MDFMKFYLVDDVHYVYAPSKLEALLFLLEDYKDSDEVIHIVEIDRDTVVGFACWNGEHQEIYLGSLIEYRGITQLVEVEDY